MGASLSKAALRWSPQPGGRRDYGMVGAAGRPNRAWPGLACRWPPGAGGGLASSWPSADRLAGSGLFTNLAALQKPESDDSGYPEGDYGVVEIAITAAVEILQTK